MKIKSIVTISLLAFILASCAPAAKVAPTETTVPTSTFTSIPPTPTITPTLDPMKSAPNGATGIDNDGKYYMEVDGYKFYYFEATTEQEAYWARPYIENYYAYDHWDINAIPIDVWVKLGTPGSESIVKMTHRDVKTSDDRSNTQLELNTFMLEKFQLTELKDLREGLNSNDGLAYNFIFNATKMSSTFGKDSGFKVTFVSEEELIPLYEEHMAVRSNGTLGFVYLTYDGVKNGQVLVRIASSQSLDKLLTKDPVIGDPEYAFRSAIFLPLMNILIADDNDDLINIAAMRDAGIVASGSSDPRSQDGNPDLQIEHK